MLLVEVSITIAITQHSTGTFLFTFSNKLYKIGFYMHVLWLIHAHVNYFASATFIKLKCQEDS